MGTTRNKKMPSAKGMALGIKVDCPNGGKCGSMKHYSNSASYFACAKAKTTNDKQLPKPSAATVVLPITQPTLQADLTSNKSKSENRLDKDQTIAAHVLQQIPVETILFSVSAGGIDVKQLFPQALSISTVDSDTYDQRHPSPSEDSVSTQPCGLIQIELPGGPQSGEAAESTNSGILGMIASGMGIYDDTGLRPDSSVRTITFYGAIGRLSALLDAKAATDMGRPPSSVPPKLAEDLRVTLSNAISKPPSRVAV